MNLSDHFTLDEFAHSQTAARLGINNDPPIEALPALKRTAAGLELVRDLLGMPITVSSGWRGVALNAAVHGSKSSQHMVGEAVDFICPAFGSPKQIVDAILASSIRFDQLIEEYGEWVHISFVDTPRLMALTIDKDGTRPYA